MTKTVTRRTALMHDVIIIIAIVESRRRQQRRQTEIEKKKPKNTNNNVRFQQYTKNSIIDAGAEDPTADVIS